MTLKTIKAYARAVAITFEITLRQNFSDAFIIFAVIVQPMIIAILALWMLRDIGGDIGIFVIVGSGLTGLWSGLLFISGNSITGERWVGTLEGLVASPTPMAVIVFGKNLANVFQSLASMIASYIAVALLFDLRITIEQPWLFAASLLVTVVAFICFGLIMAGLFVINPAFAQFQNGLEFPIYILAGFLFPIAMLPGWTTPISYVLAPYWAAVALHGSATGSVPPAEIGFAWLMMLVFSLVYVLASGRIFRIVLRKARVDATLSMQ
ncbi:MAG: ABC transporter permease [Chloroflexi bacterium]|nr:ABC transporter permease [Chloroflexota bacterium]